MKLRGEITGRMLDGHMTEWSWHGGPVVALSEQFLYLARAQPRGRDPRILVGPYRLRRLATLPSFSYTTDWVPDTALGALIAAYWHYRTWARRIEYRLLFAAFRLGWLDYQLNAPATWWQLKILKRLAPRG